jgi:hypothetical protein
MVAERACAEPIDPSDCGQHKNPNPNYQMKITRIPQLIIFVILLGLALPARAETMSVPSKEKAAFTFDVPSDWKPKGDANDESVEAGPADDSAYVTAWMAAGDEKTFVKDLESTLKDSMKSIDPGYKESEADQNGTHFHVITGSGLDKRAGSKVKFLVGIFPTGGGKVGIVYADYDADAADSTMSVLKGILNSIKVKK